MLNRALFVSLLIFLSLFIHSCVPPAPPKQFVEGDGETYNEIVSRFSKKDLYDFMPKEDVVVLYDSTTLSFKETEYGNRLLKKSVKWYYVRATNRKYLKNIAIYHPTSIEKPIHIEVQAYLEDGKEAVFSRDEMHKSRYESGRYRSETFQYARELDYYQKKMLVRLEVIRNYFKPENMQSQIFQNNYPTIKSRIKLKLPLGHKIKFGLENFENLKITTKSKKGKRTEIHYFTTEHLEGINEYDRVPQPHSYYSGLYASFPPEGIQSYTWQELGDYYLEQLEGSRTGTLIETERANHTNSDKKTSVENAFAFTRDSIRYHFDPVGGFGFVPRNVDSVLDNRYGDCKELATVFHSLIESQKGKHGVVLVTTPGKFRSSQTYPSLASFNHMINYVYLPDQKEPLIVDATNKDGTLENSAYYTRGRPLFILEKGNSRWHTPSVDNSNYRTITTKNEIVLEKSKWILQGTITLQGIPAFDFYTDNEKEIEEQRPNFWLSYLEENFDIKAKKVGIKTLQLDKVVLDYKTNIEGDYVPLEAGGFRLNKPALFSTKRMARPEDLKGHFLVYPINQQDEWKLPETIVEMNTKTVEKEGFNGDWRAENNLVFRNYHQSFTEYSHQDEDYVQFFKSLKRFRKGTAWF